jgi:hypothetical protein
MRVFSLEAIRFSTSLIFSFRVFNIAFHWENETTYLAAYETDGVLGFERSMSANQQFDSKDYVTS